MLQDAETSRQPESSQEVFPAAWGSRQLEFWQLPLQQFEKLISPQPEPEYITKGENIKKTIRTRLPRKKLDVTAIIALPYLRFTPVL